MASKAIKKIKRYKPYTPSRRFMTVADFSALTAKKPHKKLTRALKSQAGRDNLGHISVRHRGGRVKRKYRLIDFKQFKFDVPAKVLTIEYDPNRTAFIALMEYQDKSKTKSYILAPEKLAVGDEVISGEQTPLAPGNRLELRNIPTGSQIHNLEMQPRGGGKLVRGAGQSATILSKEAKLVNVKLPSGEIRRFHSRCLASLGSLSNPTHSAITIGKAGRQRWKGIRPTVRGKAMYPAAHPHGGGEGGSPIGLKHPKTPWGKPALGVKTRRKKKPSNKFIVKRRKR